MVAIDPDRNRSLLVPSYEIHVIAKLGLVQQDGSQASKNNEPNKGRLNPENGTCHNPRKSGVRMKRHSPTFRKPSHEASYYQHAAHGGDKRWNPRLYSHQSVGNPDNHTD